MPPRSLTQISPEGGNLYLAEALADNFRDLLLCPACTTDPYNKDQGGKADKANVVRRRWVCRKAARSGSKSGCPNISCSDYIKLGRKHVPMDQFNDLITRLIRENPDGRVEASVLRSHLIGPSSLIVPTVLPKRKAEHDAASVPSKEEQHARTARYRKQPTIEAPRPSSLQQTSAPPDERPSIRPAVPQFAPRPSLHQALPETDLSLLPQQAPSRHPEQLKPREAVSKPFHPTTPNPKADLKVLLDQVLKALLDQEHAERTDRLPLLIDKCYPDPATSPVSSLPTPLVDISSPHSTSSEHFLSQVPPVYPFDAFVADSPLPYLDENARFWDVDALVDCFKRAETDDDRKKIRQWAKEGGVYKEFQNKAFQKTIPSTKPRKPLVNLNI